MHAHDTHSDNCSVDIRLVISRPEDKGYYACSPICEGRGGECSDMSTRARILRLYHDTRTRDTVSFSHKRTFDVASRLKRVCKTIP